MISPKRIPLSILASWLVLVSFATPLALASPTLEDVERAALEYIMTSKNYVDNGGFGERILNSTLDGKAAMVVIEYQTRHVGMLQMIGHFVTYLTLDPDTLQVLGCAIEETYEAVDPLPGETEPGGGDPDESGNGTKPEPGPDPDPDPDPGDAEEGYRFRISYTINQTLARIYDNKAENELTEALDLLQEAQTLLEGGEYDDALAMALRADDLVNQYLYGSGTDQGSEPDPVIMDEEYRQRICYTINQTLARIYDNKAENELTEALDLLQEARTLMDGGEYGAALERAWKAETLVSEYLYGDEPAEKPSQDPAVETPWLYGYIVIFEDQPVDDDWNQLLSRYNASYMGEATGYTEEANAYWVKVEGTTAHDLMALEGVKDVVALRGGGEPEPSPSDGESEVPEALAIPILIAAAAIIHRRPRPTR